MEDFILKFKPGTKVILHTQKYDCETKKYYPYKYICEVVEYCNVYKNCVLLSEYPGQKRDYNIWCSTEMIEYAGDNIIPFNLKR
jgi:hypothetical protein